MNTWSGICNWIEADEMLCTLKPVNISFMV